MTPHSRTFLMTFLGMRDVAHYEYVQPTVSSNVEDILKPKLISSLF